MDALSSASTAKLTSFSEGYMLVEKRSWFFNSWVRMWLVIKGTSLYCMESHESPTALLKVRASEMREAVPDPEEREVRGVIFVHAFHEAHIPYSRSLTLSRSCHGTAYARKKEQQTNKKINPTARALKRKRWR